MKKLFVSIFVLLFVMAFHKIAVTFSSIPPSEKTGAPGEKTCFTANCHLLGTLNPPNSGIDILFNNGINSYQPGSLYQISVTITDSNQKIFGFELTVLDSNELMMGDFIILDSSNTFISWAGSKQYISHFNAADPNNVGAGFFTWQFQWIAPSVNSGPLTFYTAGVAALSPVSVPAGNVHTTTLSILQDTSVGISDYTMDEFSFRIFPNPADQHVNFLMHDGVENVNRVILRSVNGQNTFRYSGEQLTGNGIDVSEIPVGLYLIQAGDHLSKKIMIIH